MGGLSMALLAAALVLAAPVEASRVDRWRPQIAAAAQRCAVPTRWIEQVMRAESGGRTHLNGAPIRSAKGAIGLMQLMPGTWLEMRARLGLGTNPDDPSDNVVAGACYLRRMYDAFGHPGLFAAYNAGPARYRRHLKGRPLPAETRTYMQRIGATDAAATPPTAAPSPSLFAIDRGPDNRTLRDQPDPAEGLFAVRARAE